MASYPLPAAIRTRLAGIRHPYNLPSSPTGGVDFSLTAEQRAKAARQRAGNWTTRGTRGQTVTVAHQCRRCRERLPFGFLDEQTKLCGICRFEVVDENNPDERLRYGLVDQS